MGWAMEVRAAFAAELGQLRDGSPPPAGSAAWPSWFGTSPLVRDGQALLALRVLLAAFMDSVWLCFIVGFAR